MRINLVYDDLGEARGGDQVDHQTGLVDLWFTVTAMASVYDAKLRLMFLIGPNNRFGNMGRLSRAIGIRLMLLLLDWPEQTRHRFCHRNSGQNGTQPKRKDQCFGIK